MRFQGVIHLLRTIPRLLGIVMMLLIGLALLFLFVMGLRRGDARLQEADNSYLSGENAKTIAERQAAFNHALSLYLDLEKDYNPRFGTGKLSYNIGNAYYQLGEYAWSILYYQRAKALMPRDERVQRNLSAALKRLSLPNPSENGFFADIFSFRPYLSLPERLQLFFAFNILALMFCSWYFYRRSRGIKIVAAFSLALMALMLLSLGYTRYFSPIQAVVVHSVDLRRDAGEHYAKVGKQPVAAGTNVEVLSESNDGKWLKVLAPSGEMGYAPQSDVRIQ